MSVHDITFEQWVIMGLAMLVGGMFGKGACFWKW